MGVRGSDSTADEIEQLRRAIAALDSQRAALGDAVVEAALAPMREKLAALQAQTAAEQRKLVTVLFADLAGFTAMSEQMDPEDVREVVNAYFRCWTTSIDEYGGELEKFIGDAVMAVFGLSTAHEDDPERAVRAALAMRQSLAALNEQLQTERGLQLAMRVGIHTGPVVVSLLDERRATDFVVVGDSVNLASRLQAAAPTGGILISRDTYRHVDGVFDVQALAPVQVKGKRQPIQVYLVERARPRTFRLATRGVEGVETRMIGRDAELKRLQDALYAAMEDSEGRFVTVLGEAGIGKSRLLYEFDNWLKLQGEPVHFFKARADPSMLYTAYSLLRNFFTLRFDIQDSDPAAVVQQKLEGGVSTAFANAPSSLAAGDQDEIMRAAHFVGRLAGFDFGSSPYLGDVGDNLQGFQERALLYLEATFHALLAERPAVLMIEDLHWADDSSLDALGRLMESLCDRPLLAIGTARPGLLQRRPHWGEGQLFHECLKLTPLSTRDSRALVDEILQKVDSLPGSLRELIIKQAEGNPFFVEELIKMLIEDGIIVKGEDRWQVDRQRLESVRVPPTLVGVLQARFDRLEREERVILQRGAVIGRIFWDQAVAFLGQNQPGEAMTPAALASLRDREMIFRREQSTFEATREYLFKHALLRDVTYESLLKRQRRLYHRRTAGWLAQVAERGRRADEYAALIARHYEQAAEPEPAAEWYWRAGRRAAARYANGEAVHAFSKALELLPEVDEPRKVEILLAREKVYELQGAQEARVQDLQTLSDLAEKGADPALRATVALRQAAYALSISDFAAAIAAAQRASELAERAPAMAIAAEGYLLQANTLIRQGELESAREHAGRALELASLHGWPALQANSLRTLGLIAYYLGSAHEARDYFERALHLFVEAGDRQGEGVVLNNLGGATFNLGDYAGADAYYNRSLQLCRKIGDRLGEGRALNNLGIVSVAGGEYERAEAYYLQSLAICRQIGHRSFEASALDNLGNLALYRYEYTRSQHYYQESLRVARQIDDRVSGSYAPLNLGRCCLAIGDYEKAWQYLQESLALNQEFSHGECHTRVSLSLYHLQLGDVASAHLNARRALELSQEYKLRSEQGWGFHVLAETLATQGDFEAAEEHFRAAVAIRRDLGEAREAVESQTGLARAYMGMSHLEEAQVEVEDVLASLQTLGLLGFDQPARVLSTCYQVLSAGRDPRAPEILEKGYRLLQECAATIEDEWQRRSFLEKVPANHELLAAWRQYREDHD